VKELSSQTVDWRNVDGQRLPDLYATPSIEARRVDLLLCRWRLGAPIRVAWPSDASETERAHFERARAAWSDVVEGLELVTSLEAEADIRLVLVEADDPSAPSGTADTVTDCIVDGGPAAFAEVEERGRIVSALITMRRENVDWAGGTTPMTDEEFLGAVIHELGHALGMSGHLTRGSSVMTVDRSNVRRAGRRVMAGEPLREPTLAALYAVPLGTVVGRVPFDPDLRPSINRLAELAAESGWRGPFGRAGGDAAHVFWQTDEGRHPGVFAFQWSDGIRGKRMLDWRLSLSARAALESARERPASR
jgi:hypothetical protein